MFSKSNALCLTAILALALPAIGISSTITAIVNPGESALTLGGSDSGGYSFDLSLGDGDEYLVTGTFSNSFPSSTQVGFFPTVKLISGAAADTDTITLDMDQDFFDAAAANWDGVYTEHIPFILSAGVTATGQRLISTVDDPTEQSVGLITGGSHAKSLSGLNGDELVTDYQLNFTFAAGTPEGSSGTSPIPEPSQTIPVVMGLVGLVVFKLRKLGSRSAGA
jgi:hypothetical protein